MTENPLLARKQLGKMLRELRLSSGKTLDDIEFTGKLWKKSKLYSIENGNQPNPSWPEVKEVAEFLGASTELTNELVRMAQACLQSGWYVPFDVPQQFQSYLDLEGAATRLCFSELEYVNGLFQTEGYIRAIQRGWGLTDEQAQPHVRFRLQRLQRFWNREPFPEVVLIMSEAALRRKVGGPDIMTEQIAHLRRLAKRPDVQVLVIPFDAGSYPSMEGKYTLLEFNSGAYPEVTYVESRSECQYHERPAVVALYKRIFKETLQVAVPIEEFEL